MKPNLSHISSIAARRALALSDKWSAQYWHDNPFGDQPKADEATYRALWEAEKKSEYAEVDALEKTSGFALSKDWLDDLALHTQIVIKDSPLCYQHGRVLYSVLREYLKDTRKSGINIVETGTARGFSALCMAKALEDGGAHGQILTFDLLPQRVKMYWNCIDDCEGPKSREELIAPWSKLARSILFIEGDSRVMLEKMAIAHIDFAFLDGAHTYKDVMKEFSLVAPYQESGDIIVFDDYSTKVFPGLVKAVDEGCEKWMYAKTVITTNKQRAYVIAKKL